MLTIIQNDERVPAGLYGDWLAMEKIAHRVVRIDRGESLPDPVPGARLIVLGGTMSVYDVAEFPFLALLEELLRGWVDSGRPLLGICLGGQLLAKVLGGKVSCNQRGEHGLLPVELTPAGEADPLFSGIGQPLLAMQWHNDSFDLPPAAVHLAATLNCPAQAFRVGRCSYGVQFHPELTTAIVADWSRRSNLGDDHVSALASREAAYRSASLKILDNFLHLPAA